MDALQGYHSDSEDSGRIAAGNHVNGQFLNSRLEAALARIQVLEAELAHERRARLAQPAAATMDEQVQQAIQA